MKQEIIKIAQDLEQGKVTTKKAQALLLGLFGVGGSFSPNDCENDITRCPKCSSPDHSMITGQPYKCRDCGHVW